MPTRVWAMLCEYATLGAHNRPTIIGEFDKWTFPALPGVIPVFYVISKWEAGKNDRLQYAVRITTPSGVTWLESEITTVVMQSGDDWSGYYIALLPVVGVSFTEAGEYGVDFVLDGFVVHTLPLEISEG